MSKEEPYRQKTDETRQRIHRKSQRLTYGEMEQSNLPPRSEVHQQKRKKRIRYPLIRLLALLFILIPITILAIVLNRPDDVPVQTNPVEKQDHEKISIDDNEEVESDVNDEDSSSEVESDPEDEQGEADTTDDPVNSASGANEDKVTNREPEPSNNQSQTQTPQKVNNKIVYHTVQPGDNLFRIALKYYHSKSGIDIIKKANNLSSDQIQLGQVLKIPLQ